MGLSTREYDPFSKRKLSRELFFLVFEKVKSYRVAGMATQLDLTLKASLSVNRPNIVSRLQGGAIHKIGSSQGDRMVAIWTRACCKEHTTTPTPETLMTRTSIRLRRVVNMIPQRL